MYISKIPRMTLSFKLEMLRSSTYADAAVVTDIHRVSLQERVYDRDTLDVCAVACERMARDA